jgi:hypothetical protein
LEEPLNKIAEAIIGLQSNPLKDYVFPSVMSLSSALLGAWAAFYAVNTQERDRNHIQNVDSINEFMLCANDARNTLIAIKSNYHDELSSHPCQRLLAVPRIITNGDHITFQMSKLIFMTPSEISEIHSRWQKITYIESLFSNYNHVLDIWKKRNDALDEIVPKLSQHHGVQVGLNTLLNSIDAAQLAIISDLTEHALMMTDDILFELSCLLIGLPEVGKKLIPINIRKKYRKIISILLPDNDAAVNILSLSPELDYEAAAELHKTTVSDLKNRYRRIYL